MELEALFDISLAISSVLNESELREEILWRSVGVLNVSKGMIILENENSPILDIKLVSIGTLKMFCYQKN